MDLQQETRMQAVVLPIHEATIVPKISAPILKFYVNCGDLVRAGELLAVLANRDLQAAVAESKGGYEQAQANYENATAAQLPVQMQGAEKDVQNARSAFHAASYLYESDESLYKQGALAKEKLDQAQVALVQARTALTVADQQLQKLQMVGKAAQIKAAEGRLGFGKGKVRSRQGPNSPTRKFAAP